jgi:rod shape-determining protein MreC
MPLLQAALVPFEPVRQAGRAAGEVFTLNSELERLRNENQRLKGWEWRATELERKLADLSATAGAARDPQIPFITARVVASSSGAFVRSAMINTGRQEGLKAGHPVLGGDGVVGRIVDTGANAARVLLLTDAQSRIPVLVGADYARAVLVGDNGPQPKLVFAEPALKASIGDDVSTSGVGGLFPRGLRIGKVVAVEPELRVAPQADLDGVEYVSILLYETAALNLIETLPAARSSAGLEADTKLKRDGSGP